MIFQYYCETTFFQNANISLMHVKLIISYRKKVLVQFHVNLCMLCHVQYTLALHKHVVDCGIENNCELLIWNVFPFSFLFSFLNVLNLPFEAAHGRHHAIFHMKIEKFIFSAIKCVPAIIELLITNLVHTFWIFNAYSHLLDSLSYETSEICYFNYVNTNTTRKDFFLNISTWVVFFAWFRLLKSK